MLESTYEKSSCRFHVEQILNNPYLKVTDKDVLVSIASTYYIDSEPGLVNDYLRDQTELEAKVVYLTSKYSGILVRLESKLEEVTAEVSLDAGDRTESGYKMTRENKRLLLFCDSKYTVLREKVLGFKILYEQLEKLSMIVFRRQNKLEQLSVNYRKETEADKRHGF